MVYVPRQLHIKPMSHFDVMAFRGAVSALLHFAEQVFLYERNPFMLGLIKLAWVAIAADIPAHEFDELEQQYPQIKQAKQLLLP